MKNLKLQKNFYKYTLCTLEDLKIDSILSADYVKLCFKFFFKYRGQNSLSITYISYFVFKILSVKKY